MVSEALLARIDALDPFPEIGRIRRISSGEIQADGPDAPVSAHCEIIADRDGLPLLRAQVASVSSEAITLIPFQGVERARIGDRVRLLADREARAVGDALAGRAVNALAAPIDGGAPPELMRHDVRMLDILDRIAPDRPFITGIRAIDALLTMGYGQRIGIFAPSGVGKTRLIEQVIRQADCRRIIVCQIGERGREVEALWAEIKSSGKRDEATIVAATSDESAPMRALCLDQALGMAEYWRDKGEDVVLIVDSITRYAMALREIGLVAGEPPMLRAYTPNVLRELPRIVERCGTARAGGSITGIFTVLSEGEDVDDPIVEVMKSLLDGHVILSRKLAEAGHFPAIDISRSISRLFDRLADREHVASARTVRALLARYEEARILVESGMYKAGSDKNIDLAISAREPILAFLRQSDRQAAPLVSTLEQLASLSGEGG